MSNKIQGEGDYESARRFNKEEQEFVKRKFGKMKTQEASDAEKIQEASDAEMDHDYLDADADSDDDTEISDSEELRKLRRASEEPSQRR